MKKRVIPIGMTMLLSCWCLLMTAQATVNKCEYWFDYAYDSRTPISITDGNWVQQLDVGTLQPGLHVMAYHVGTSDGRWSPVLVKNILVPQPSSLEENVLKTYEYWVDHDFEHKVSGDVAASGIIDLNIDFSALSPGLHNIAFRVLDANGHASSIIVKNFLVPEPLSMAENGLSKYRYWIDRDVANMVEVDAPADGIISFDVDASALSEGPHELSYQVIDKVGHVSATSSHHFLKETIQGDGKLIAIDYWFNDEPRQRITIDPAESVDKSDIVIPMDGVKPRTISEEYTFDATTKTVKTTETITVGIQVFNDGGVGSEAVVHTLENVTLTVTPLFEALTNESSATKAAPKDGQMQGFSYTGAVGDELYWDITGSDAKVDFKDAEGNTITTTTKEIGGKTVIVLTMPTTSVYLLAYGATTDDDIVVKVAQPVTLTVANATREYGDANPAFTYTSSGAAVTGEVAYTTTADVTSVVGDYPVTIDLTGVTNTYVTVVPGTLTIEKATLKVGVADASMTAGEQLPVFSLTYEGFKNDEDETVLTTLPQVTTDATSSSEPGDYVLTVSGGEATNYTFTYTNGTLTIEVPTGIQQISADRPVNVYTLGGVLVRRGATTLDGLSDGVYIINGKKVYVRRKR